MTESPPAPPDDYLTIEFDDEEAERIKFIVEWHAGRCKLAGIDPPETVAQSLLDCFETLIGALEISEANEEREKRTNRGMKLN